MAVVTVTQRALIFLEEELAIAGAGFPVTVRIAGMSTSAGIPHCTVVMGTPRVKITKARTRARVMLDSLEMDSSAMVNLPYIYSTSSPLNRIHINIYPGVPDIYSTST